MSNIPDELHYTEEHEYVRTESDGTVTVGITDYAQGELGDVVYVELPEVGATFTRMDVFGTIEAVKAVSELYSPVSGEVIEINPAIESDAAIINKDPYGEGWMIKMSLSNPTETDGLLTHTDYAQHIGE